MKPGRFEKPSYDPALTAAGVSDRVADLVVDLDVFAVILDRVAFVLPDFQDHLVGARRLVGMLVGRLGAGRHRGHWLAVTADLPPQAAGPVVAHLGTNDLATFQPER